MIKFYEEEYDAKKESIILRTDIMSVDIGHGNPNFIESLNRKGLPKNVSILLESVGPAYEIPVVKDGKMVSEDEIKKSIEIAEKILKMTKEADRLRTLIDSNLNPTATQPQSPPPAAPAANKQR